MDDDEIGTKEASEILGVHQRHVRWYHEQAMLPGRIIKDLAGRKLLVFKRSDVEKFQKPKIGRKPAAKKPAPKDKPAPKANRKKGGAQADGNNQKKGSK
jgi:hypothetical protein